MPKSKRLNLHAGVAVVIDDKFTGYKSGEAKAKTEAQKLALIPAMAEMDGIRRGMRYIEAIGT